MVHVLQWYNSIKLSCPTIIYKCYCFKSKNYPSWLFFYCSFICMPSFHPLACPKLWLDECSLLSALTIWAAHAVKKITEKEYNKQPTTQVIAMQVIKSPSTLHSMQTHISHRGTLNNTKLKYHIFPIIHRSLINAWCKPIASRGTVVPLK